MMKRFARRMLVMLSLLLAFVIGRSVSAGEGCSDCEQPCAPKITMVQMKIMVPQWSTERRMINVTTMVREERVRNYVVHRMVPEVRQVEKEFDVMVPVTQQREVRDIIQVPVYHEVERHYVDYVRTYRDVHENIEVQVPHWEDVHETIQVMVPHIERRVASRTVCQMVRDVEVREVCRDEGHWEKRSYKVDCGPECGGCGKPHYNVCRVWVPNIVKHQVEVPVMRPKMVSQPYEYDVTVCLPEKRDVVRHVCRYETQQRDVVRRVCDLQPVQRSRMVRVCELQPQERVRNVSYTECELRHVVRRVNETYCHYVEEPRTEHYTVCVPRIEQREINVSVCRMVPKVISVPAPCNDGGDYGGWVPRRMRWLLRCVGC